MWMVAAALAMGTADDRPLWRYLRTNSDGSEPETVVVFREAPGRIAVFKEKSRCTNAAYVTGELDPATGQAWRLLGGRLTRELTQQPFAWLTRNDAGLLQARLGAPDAAPVFEIATGPRWVMYDFDFSDLISHPPAEIALRRDVSFEMPLILTGEGAPQMRNLGEARLRFDRAIRYRGAATYRYRIDGPALGKAAGTIWFARAGGHIVDAQLPIPNHAEYRDFRLRLVGQARGEAAWRAILADHWKGCPAR